MNLYIIRHGNTTWNALGKIQGSSDIDLDDKGINEAVLLRETLKDLSIDIFITSPLKRAIHTAKILNVEDLPLKIEKDLTELSFGEWEGMTWDEVQRDYRSYLPENTTNGYSNPPGGETYNDAYARISKVTDCIIKMPYTNIAIITHRAVIRFMLAYLLKDTVENISTFQLPNAAIIKLTNEKANANSECKIQNAEFWRFLG